jgi:3'-5' exoribonuclease
MWNVTEGLFRSLPTDGFVRVEGQTQPYQGEIQIIIQTIEAVEPSERDLADLLPCSEHDPEQMYGELCAILETIEHGPLRVLVRAYLEDAALMAQFKQAPAAMALHHAFLGGLLEHTLSLLRLGSAVCSLYPRLNRDIVLFGLFIHDLGKCDELTWKRGFGYSDHGQLVGHVAGGVLRLQKKVEQCEASGAGISAELLMVLQHLVLSHHGQLEFGALKLPATPEAIAVSLLDNFDAKVHMAVAATRSGLPDAVRDDVMGGSFTEKIWALDTRLYRPDPTRR